MSCFAVHILHGDRCTKPSVITVSQDCVSAHMKLNLMHDMGLSYILLILLWQVQYNE